MKPDEIVTRVRDAGVVGAGGAGFPTHVKLSARAEIVIVNGAECEPLLVTDQYLLSRYTEEVFAGLGEAISATGARQGVIALKGEHRRLLTYLQVAASRWQGRLPAPVRIHVLPDVYPAGDEHVLVYEVTGKLTPPGGIPLAVGAVVLNVETAVNVAAAVGRRQPVTHTWVTVAGEVLRPGVFRVPVGARLRDVLRMAGGPGYDSGRAGACSHDAGPTAGGGVESVVGGPLMGVVGADPDLPVTKLVKGLLVLPATSPTVRAAMTPLGQALRQAAAVCCSCRACTDCCPRYLLGHPLEPHRLMAMASGRLQPNLTLARSALLCSECGLCEQWSCPMGLSPRRVARELKRLLRDQGIAYTAPAATANAAGAAGQGIRGGRSSRQVPSARLTARLGLRKAAEEMVRLYGDPVRMPDAIEIVPDAGVLRVPLLQHSGAPAEPVVTVGEVAKAGTVLGEPPAGGLGARVHTGISGFVSEIDERFVTLRI